MTIDTDDIDPAVESSGDKAYRVTRAALSAIPGVGGTAVELFTSIIEPPLERRRRKWMVDVTEALNRLEQERGIDIESLQENEQFFTTLVQASQAALRNHQDEKLSALKNSVCNSALPNPPEESLQQIFLNFIDSFTVWHLKILNLFQDPTRWAERNNHQFPNLSMGGRSNLLESAFSELRGNREFYDQVWADLYQRGLVNSDSLHVTMSGNGLFGGCLTVIGQQFLSFIGDPLSET